MKRAIILTTALLLNVTICLAEQPWQQKYEGDEATGEHVVALWSFDGDVPLVDVTETFKLSLRGKSRIAEDGKFGGCLESFRTIKPAGAPKGDPNGAMLVTKKPGAITPEGPFTVEMWIKTKDEIAKTGNVRLVDAKYVFYKHKHPRMNAGFGLELQRRKGNDTFRAIVGLGFGEESESLSTDTFTIKPGEWTHLAMTYDGEGTVTVFANGNKVSSRTCKTPGRKGVAPARVSLTIGDRYGSNYRGFPGHIDQVRICNKVIEFKPAE